MSPECDRAQVPVNHQQLAQLAVELTVRISVIFSKRVKEVGDLPIDYPTNRRNDKQQTEAGRKQRQQNPPQHFAEFTSRLVHKS